MPKTTVLTNAERAYLEKRLAPVFNALRKDEGLRDEFLMFMRARGSSLSLTLERLRTVWWKSRRSMYPGFLVLAAVEFEFAHGLLVLEGGKKPLR